VSKPERAEQMRGIAHVYRVPVLLVDPESATRWQRLRWWLKHR
jgi:hypothetical protein